VGLLCWPSSQLLVSRRLRAVGQARAPAAVAPVRARREGTSLTQASRGRCSQARKSLPGISCRAGLISARSRPGRPGPDTTDQPPTRRFTHSVATGKANTEAGTATQNGGYLRYAQARANYRASEADDCRRPGACLRRWPTVFGGAYGIDATAHRGVLATRPVTIAVLGPWCRLPYSAGHADLFTDSAAGGGLAISEWAPSRPAAVPRAPGR
jgi:DNA recombination-mediator protein A